jgi:nucleoside-diphosphate-sugar epimerase
MAEKMKVLVTGGSGRLGQMIARHCADRYTLRLTYHHHPIAAPAAARPWRWI